MSKKTSFPLTQAMPSAASKSEEDYQTEGHLRTLMDAENIKSDPEKMKKVHKLAGRHKKAITSIRDLKNTYQDKYGQPSQKAPKGDDDDGDEY
jgi:hypothetical protein